MLLVLLLVRIGAGSYRLTGAYPRIVRWSKGEDVVLLLLRVAFAAWCGWELLR